MAPGETATVSVYLSDDMGREHLPPSGLPVSAYWGSERPPLSDLDGEQQLFVPPLSTSPPTHPRATRSHQDPYTMRRGRHDWAISSPPGEREHSRPGRNKFEFNPSQFTGSVPYLWVCRGTPFGKSTAFETEGLTVPFRWLCTHYPRATPPSPTNGVCHVA